MYIILSVPSSVTYHLIFSEFSSGSVPDEIKIKVSWQTFVHQKLQHNFMIVFGTVGVRKLHVSLPKLTGSFPTSYRNNFSLEHWLPTRAT